MNFNGNKGKQRLHAHEGLPSKPSSCKKSLLVRHQVTIMIVQSVDNSSNLKNYLEKRNSLIKSPGDKLENQPRRKNNHFNLNIV